MDRQEQKFIRMTTEPVGRLICEMSVPTIVSMLVTAAYNMVDTFFVGQMHSNSATGAVGVVFSMMTIMQAVGFFFGQGSGTYMSRQLGSKNVENASRMAITGVVLSTVTGAVITVLGLLFLDPLARFLGSTETILPYARDYLRFILLGAPYMMASFTLNNQLRFQGSAQYAMYGILTGAVINVGLDPLLIFTFDMGIAGAALATILGQFASFCLLLVGTTRGGNLRLRFSHLQISRSILVEIWKGGFPSLCRQGLMSVSTICLNTAARIFGDVAIAAMGIVSRSMMMANSAVIGFGQGFQPVIGFNYGAGLIERIKKGFWFCIRWGTLFLLFVGAAGFAFAPQIIAVFRDDPAVIAFGARALRFQCCTVFASATVITANMMTQCMGKTGYATLLAMARQGLFLIPMVLVLPSAIGELGLQLAQPIADVLSLGVTLVVMRSVWRELDTAQISDN